MKSVIRYLYSVKLAIFLLIIITLASVLGTLIPQHRSIEEYTALYGQAAELLISLEFTRLYNSWWFVGLLFIFALNTIVCTLHRLGPKWKRAFNPDMDAEHNRILAFKIHNQQNFTSELNEAKEDMMAALSSRRYRIREKNGPQKSFLLARKKILGIFGSDIVHLGLLIIILGGIISGILGVRQNLSISEGQLLDIPGADFKLRMDKFQTDYYPTGSVKDWKSHLVVVEGGEDILSKTIEVNHPLSYQGFVFYQSSYGWNWENPSLDIGVKKKSDPEFLDRLTIRIGQKILLSDGKTEVAAVNFVPDFILNENNKVTTRSLQPNNPAVFIEGYHSGEKNFSGWVFQKYPDYTRIHSQEETDFTVEFYASNAPQYSGLQMSRDPGVNYIWAGSTLLMLGLFIAFYWPTSEIKVFMEEINGKIKVSSGGLASKNKETFKTEFASILASVRRKV